MPKLQGNFSPMEGGGGDVPPSDLLGQKVAAPRPLNEFVLFVGQEMLHAQPLHLITINSGCSSYGPVHSGFEAVCIQKAGDYKGAAVMDRAA